MGNAPGNARGLATQVLPKGRVTCFGVWHRVQPGAVRLSYGKCHREQTAGGAQHGGIAQGNLRDVFEMHASFGKGEKVG